MLRKGVALLVLGLAVCSVVAIVRAQVPDDTDSLRTDQDQSTIDTQGTSAPGGPLVPPRTLAPLAKGNAPSILPRIIPVESTGQGPERWELDQESGYIQRVAAGSRVAGPGLREQRTSPTRRMSAVERRLLSIRRRNSKIRNKEKNTGGNDSAASPAPAGSPSGNSTDSGGTGPASVSTNPPSTVSKSVPNNPLKTTTSIETPLTQGPSSRRTASDTKPQDLAKTNTKELVTSEPTTSEPTTSEPTTSEPAKFERANDESTKFERANDESTKFERANDEPTKFERANDEPTKFERANDESTKFERANDEPTNDEPTNNEPTNNEPTNDEPTNDEPTNNEPTTSEVTYGEPKPRKSTVKSNVIGSSTSPSLQVATIGPQTIVVGKESTYVVSVVNSSPAEALGVAINISLPETAEVVSAEASSGEAIIDSVVENGGSIKWSIEQLRGEDEERLELRVIPRKSELFELSVNWDYEPEASVARIQVKEPRLEMSLHGEDDLLYGETKVYTISVSNPGTCAAENVVVNLLPVNSDQQLAGVRRLGTLEAGENRRIELELAAQQPGDLEIRVRAFADGGLRSEAIKQVLVRRAHLEVDLEAPQIKYAGTTATYRTQIRNTGNATANNIVVSVIIPRGAEFVDSMGRFQPDTTNDGRVRWKVGQLRPGAESEIVYRCTLGAPGTNRMEVVAEGPNELAAFQSAVTVVEALADLKLEVDDPRGPNPVGKKVEYDVRVVNRGTKAAEDIHVFAYFSDGIEPLSTDADGARIETGQVILNPIEHLAAGATKEFRIIARAESSGSHVFRVELECRDPETELAQQETTAFYGEGLPDAANRDEQRQSSREPAVRR